MTPWRTALLTLAMLGCRTTVPEDSECVSDPRACHDRDGDGFELRDDCDDANAEVNPEAEEIPGDGVDNDCNPDTEDGGEDTDDTDIVDPNDKDGDGFETDEDCDDEDSSINPSRPEIPYDGDDNDCDPSTLDDDLDQDGYDLDEDCDDKNDLISPGATEIPYTDVDEDCDPNTPDDDLDGDGFPLDTDCDDEDAARSPGNSETAYNGIDDDCDPTTPDDDLDDDGYNKASDCDDQDEDSNPGAIEIFGDGKDNDCDGNQDVVDLIFDDLALDSPRDPVIDSDGVNFMFAIAADAMDDGTTSYTEVGAILWFDAGSYGALIHDPIPFKTEIQNYPIDGAVDLEAELSAFYPSVSWYEDSGAKNVVALPEYLWNSGTASYDEILLSHAHSGPGSVPFPARDIDVRIASDGTRWVLACGDDHVHAYRTPDTTTGGHSVSASAVDYTHGGHTCFLDPDTTPAEGTVCDTSGCTTLEIDPGGNGITEASSQPWSSRLVDAVDVHDGWRIVVESGGGLTVEDGVDSYDLLPGETVLSADAAWWNDVLYWIAVLDPGGGADPEVRLTWGEPDAPSLWVDTTIDFSDPPRDLVAEGVAVHVQGGRMAYAVSGTDRSGGDDALGWSFLGIP